MDFYEIKERPGKNGCIEVYADFRTDSFKDLMVRGKSFYAIWDQEKGVWSKNENEPESIKGQIKTAKDEIISILESDYLKKTELTIEGDDVD